MSKTNDDRRAFLMGLLFLPAAASAAMNTELMRKVLKTKRVISTPQKDLLGMLMQISDIEVPPGESLVEHHVNTYSDSLRPDWVQLQPCEVPDGFVGALGFAHTEGREDRRFVAVVNTGRRLVRCRLLVQYFHSRIR